MLKLLVLLIVGVLTNAERIVPSGGNPCLTECDLSKGGNPASEACASCCRTVPHEIPWHCDDMEKAALSCKGEWDPMWWDIPSPDNFMHACAACCGDCSSGFFHSCGPCVKGKGNCHCGDCHLIDDETISCTDRGFNSTCVCPHSKEEGWYWVYLIVVLPIVMIACLCAPCILFVGKKFCFKKESS